VEFTRALFFIFQDDGSQTSTQSESQSLFPFSLEDSRLISYKTKVELDKYLQQLKELWINALGKDTSEVKPSSFIVVSTTTGQPNKANSISQNK
jgi:hypothetical protein